ncbi:hypothetical protein HDF24_21820 [Mucilaginibacter sp. X4EP1]|uniref:hypothetical protein n=1 Tax=Mucilaginibacter sp. X4EP1 TaxID=2723092 RepID=UPI002168F6D8|nr:hypothetical protein [Mucilaginibacter sp. X4EP1]MCS3812376.1 hypothetical protein [Mucilaginibacter sp. X4EP1]
MYYDLPKKDKKLARQLMDKGLLIEFEQGLKSFDTILQEWKSGNSEIRDTYSKIYTAVKEFDKHIARRYDGIGGSRYLETVIAQLMDNLYDVSEIDGFSPEVKEDTLRSIKMRKEF